MTLFGHGHPRKNHVDQILYGVFPRLGPEAPVPPEKDPIGGQLRSQNLNMSGQTAVDGCEIPWDTMGETMFCLVFAEENKNIIPGFLAFRPSAV